MESIPKDTKYNVKTVVALAAIVATVCLFCVVLRLKLDSLLYNNISGQVAQRAFVLAQSVNARINVQLDALSSIAHLAENDTTRMCDILSAANFDEGQVNYGIVSLDGTLVCGDSSVSVKPNEFSGIVQSFRGKHIASYNSERGILLSVPIYRNGKVRNVLYKLYDNIHARNYFDAGCMEDDCYSSIRDQDGNTIVGFDSPIDFSLVENDLKKQMELYSSSAYRKRINGSVYYFFMADLQLPGLSLVGMIPELSLNHGVNQVASLVLGGVGALALLLFAGFGVMFFVDRRHRDKRHRRNLLNSPEEIGHVKSVVLESVGHEILSPIGEILGMDTIIIKESKDPFLKEYAQNIQSAGQSLLSLANSIMDLSKMEVGNMELYPVEYNLFNILCDCYKMAVIRINEKALHFEIEVDQTIPSDLLGDEVRIRQIINNLLQNAIKYTTNGSIAFKIGYERQEKAHSDNLDTIMLTISVQDTGIGIRDEEMSKLFMAFRRIENRSEQEAEGTGLGLTLVKRLVDLMNGSIVVDSEYGKGSNFKVVIPQKVIKNEVIGDFNKRYREYVTASEIPRSHFRAQNASILAVDDVPMNLRVMTGLLKETAVQVDIAGNGMEAIEKIKRKHYDIIFIDQVMPIMDGIETRSIIKSLADHPNKETPIILLSINTMSEAREACQKANFTDFLTKPLREENLFAILLQYLPAELISYDEPEKSEIDQNLDESYYTQSHMGVPLVADKNEPSQQNDGLESYQKIKEIERLLPEDLENLAASGFVDVKLGINCAEKDENQYRKNLQDYSSSNMDALLEKSLKEEDFERYRLQVRTLKKRSLEIGGIDIASLAKSVEYACNTGNYDFVRMHHSELIREYRNFIKVLKELI